MAFIKQDTEFKKLQDANIYYIRNQSRFVVGLLFVRLPIIYYVIYLFINGAVYIGTSEGKGSILGYISNILTGKDMVFVRWTIGSAIFVYLGLKFIKAKTYVDLESKQIYNKILWFKSNLINFEEIINIDYIIQAGYNNSLYKLNIVKRGGARSILGFGMTAQQATSMINQIYALFKSIGFIPKDEKIQINQISDKVARFRLVDNKLKAGFIYDSWGNLLWRFLLFLGILGVIGYLFVYQRNLLFECDPREAFDGFTCYMIRYALPIAFLLISFFTFKMQVFDMNDRAHYKSIFGRKWNIVRLGNIFRYNVVLNYHNGIYNGTSIYLTHNTGVLEVSLHGDSQEYEFVNFIKNNILTNDKPK